MCGSADVAEIGLIPCTAGVVDIGLILCDIGLILFVDQLIS